MYQPDHAATNPADGSAEAPEAAVRPADDDEAASAMVAVAEEPASGASNDAPSAGPAEHTETVEPPRPTPVQSFQAELARAMQAAAFRERQRIATLVADDAVGQVEKVKARAASETAELRRLADEDVKGIADWSASEIERIRRETARRTEERRASLEEHIVRHGGIIEREIGSVDGAVNDYKATLDRYFGQLAESSDPAEIARLAGELPEPPDLQDVRATARSAAVADETAREADDNGDGPGGEVTSVGVAVPIDRSGDDPHDPDGNVGSPEQGNPAVRLLRTIAPWTAPTDRTDEEPPQPQG